MRKLLAIGSNMLGYMPNDPDNVGWAVLYAENLP